MCHRTPYSGRGATRVLVIPKDEPPQALDALSILYDAIHSGVLRGMVIRIPDSGAVIVDTSQLFSAAHLRDGQALLDYFGERLMNRFWFIEPLDRCRHIAVGLGWDDFSMEVRQWRSSSQ